MRQVKEASQKSWPMLKVTQNIILASSSRFRATLLAQAGVVVSYETPKVDERELEKNSASHSAADLALLLAEAKSEEVSSRFPDCLVIGCDQILACENHILHKVKDKQEARQRLQFLSGKCHQLHMGLAVYESGNKLWQHQECAYLTMRPLTGAFIEAYLHRVGEGVLTTPGLYHIEGLGIQLFEKISGDWHSIIGLPLLPLLDFLRKREVLDG